VRSLQPLRLRTLWLAIGWAMVVTVILLSLIPLEADLSEGKDKWSHFVAYGLMTFWFCLLYFKQGQWAAAFIAMGIVIEVLQSYTGYRSFEYADMVADAIGVLLGWFLAQTPLRSLLQWLEYPYTRNLL
jgi:VanZ family protein